MRVDKWTTVMHKKLLFSTSVADLKPYDSQRIRLITTQ